MIGRLRQLSEPSRDRKISALERDILVQWVRKKKKHAKNKDGTTCNIQLPDKKKGRGRVRRTRRNPRDMAYESLFQQKDHKK